MHSVDQGREPSEDLTARARIRDAAITVFGKHGFDAPLRLIAEHAGVSPALVIHHYGSKVKLRVVADDHVSALIAEAKTEFIADQAPGTLLTQLAQLDDYAWILGYLMKSVATGGALAQAMFDQMVSDAETYIDLGVRAGTLTPSRDPAARARMLAAMGLGSLLLMLSLRAPEEVVDYGALMRQWEIEHMLPTLELYTEGLFTDRTLLDAYLAHLDEEADASEPSLDD